MSKDLLINIHDKVKDKGVLDDEVINYIDSLFSERIIDVIEVIERGFSKIIFNPSKKSLWTISKRKDPQNNYFIYPKLYCTCWDFYKRVIIEKRRPFCKHLLAQTICEALDNFKIVNLQDVAFQTYIKDFKLNF